MLRVPGEERRQPPGRGAGAGCCCCGQSFPGEPHPIRGRSGPWDQTVCGERVGGTCCKGTVVPRDPLQPQALEPGWAAGSWRGRAEGSGPQLGAEAKGSRWPRGGGSRCLVSAQRPPRQESCPVCPRPLPSFLHPLTASSATGCATLTPPRLRHPHRLTATLSRNI